MDGVALFEGELVESYGMLCFLFHFFVEVVLDDLHVVFVSIVDCLLQRTIEFSQALLQGQILVPLHEFHQSVKVA